MDIHRARSQPAAAGQRQAHRASSAQQRRQIKHRAAHRPGQRRGDLPAKRFFGAQQKLRPAALHPCPDGAQQSDAGFDIRQARHGAQPYGALAQQGGCQQRQHAVFGGFRANCPLQGAPAGNDDRLHTLPPLPTDLLPIYMPDGGQLLQKQRLQLHTAPRCFHGVRQQGEIAFQAGGLAQGIVLPKGNKIVVAALQKLRQRRGGAC